MAGDRGGERPQAIAHLVMQRRKAVLACLGQLVGQLVDRGDRALGDALELCVLQEMTDRLLPLGSEKRPGAGPRAGAVRTAGNDGPRPPLGSGEAPGRWPWRAPDTDGRGRSMRPS